MTIKKPEVTTFFDEATNNATHVVVDPEARSAAIIDSLLDYDFATGRTTTHSADRIVSFVKQRALRVEWIIDTHVHADHLTAAPHLKAALGGVIAIGEKVSIVQETFGRIFNAGADFRSDGGQFDHLFRDGETYRVGSIEARAIATPGHTPACMTHLIGDAAFVGDTLFMPDYGTARCDFPGGDAAMLYRSIRKLFELPDETRLFLNHDYKAEDRDEYAWETTIGEERRANVHIHEGVTEKEFVRMRSERDRTLAAPKLIVPSVQVNMRGGEFPPPEANGVSYLKTPINML